AEHQSPNIHFPVPLSLPAVRAAVQSFESSVAQASRRREALVFAIYRMTVKGQAHFANRIRLLRAKSSGAVSPKARRQADRQGCPGSAGRRGGPCRTAELRPDPRN